MSEPVIVVGEFEPEFDVDEVAIYVDGKRVISGRKYEIDPYMVLDYVLTRLGVDARVERKFLPAPIDDGGLTMKWFLPDTL